MQWITCPSCRALVKVADDVPGKSIACPNCKRPIAVPSDAITAAGELPLNPVGSVDPSEPPPSILKGDAPTWLRLGVTWLLGFAVVSILFGLWCRYGSPTKTPRRRQLITSGSSAWRVTAFMTPIAVCPSTAPTSRLPADTVRLSEGEHERKLGVPDPPLHGWERNVR